MKIVIIDSSKIIHDYFAHLLVMPLTRPFVPCKVFWFFSSWTCRTNSRYQGVYKHRTFLCTRKLDTKFRIVFCEYWKPICNRNRNVHTYSFPSISSDSGFLSHISDHFVLALFTILLFSRVSYHPISASSNWCSGENDAIYTYWRRSVGSRFVRSNDRGFDNAVLNFP